MREIHRSNWFPDYSQLALFDVEDLTSIPDWETGIEALALGPKGIVVATENSTGVGDPVEIIVYEGSGEAPGIFLVSAIIEVGNNGPFVGDPRICLGSKWSNLMALWKDAHVCLR